MASTPSYVTPFTVIFVAMVPPSCATGRAAHAGVIGEALGLLLSPVRDDHHGQEAALLDDVDRADLEPLHLLGVVDERELQAAAFAGVVDAAQLQALRLALVVVDRAELDAAQLPLGDVEGSPLQAGGQAGRGVVD